MKPSVKYTLGRARHEVPALLDSDRFTEAQALALNAHRALGCKGCSRVDLLLPEAAAAAGISFEDLAELLLQWGLEP